jgi:hypothetical protein
LAVDDAGTWLLLPSLAHPVASAERGVDLFPGPIGTETPKIRIDGGPRRILPRDEAPGTAGSEQIDDAIEDGAHRSLARTTTGLSRWNERSQQLPFGIEEIAGIEVRRPDNMRTYLQVDESVRDEVTDGWIPVLTPLGPSVLVFKPAQT